MENKLEIKQIPFLGSELMAARDREGRIWVGVRWMCDGIGLSRNQRDGQIQKIKADKVLLKGAENFPLPTNGGTQNVLCLKLDYVPLWLAKISITPTMEEETPKLASNLEQYQLKAKDVLAAAFLPEEANPNFNNLSPELQMFKAIFDSVARTELQQREQEKAIEAVSLRVDWIRDVVALNSNAWREDSRRLISKIAQARGGGGAYQEVNSEVFRLVDERGAVSLETRLTNKRRRMADDGVCKSRRNKLTKVDVIAEDKKLIEIYISIVKEMAIKFGITANKEM